MGKERLRILLVGNGGREHALAWKLSQSPQVKIIYVVPGNGGTANNLPNVTNVDEVKPDNFLELVAFAKENEVNLVIPGPEAPLVAGIEGYFRAVGIRCFGPSVEAARLEGSKTYSKDFMANYRIPTAEYRNFDNYNAAVAYLDEVKHNVVIKADGLAAGKGVILPTTKQEAVDALKQIMLDKEFGQAGNEVVIEELLEGDELSFLSFSDGYTIRSLPPAQDHKRINEGDEGPNTGGMGCYAPTTIASEALIEEVRRTILQPTIDAMRRDEGFPFVGLLFTGIMVTETGPKCLEYNVRFGDPECQTLLPLISRKTDLSEILVACTERRLDGVELLIEPSFAATVVVASGGYPGSYPKGVDIKLDSVANEYTTLFHAGTSLVDGKLKTNGGRVIAATATAETLEAAVKKAYEGVDTIHFDKMHYRKDIAFRAFRQAAAVEEGLTYASAGVSIEAGNTLVKRIKSAVRSTKRPGADAEIGGFGGMFDLGAAGYSKDTTLIVATDGVGTKLKIAQVAGKHDTVGIDLVAMNVNDLVVQGAEALCFVDYFACSKLNVDIAADFVSGVAEGCRQAGCALVGGETAEMPEMYKGSEYDAAGTAVGAVDRNHILPNLNGMVQGDVLLGLASNGVHSNGFSLIRKIIERRGLSYDSAAPWDTKTSIGVSLLTPTRIYVKPLLPVVKKNLIKGMSHITGGGLLENIPRMLPKQLAAELDVATWTLPPVLAWLKKAGNVNSLEFGRVFNTGLGMVLVVAAEDSKKVSHELEMAGEKIYEIGKLVKNNGERCTLNNLESWD